MNIIEKEYQKHKGKTKKKIRVLIKEKTSLSTFNKDRKKMLKNIPLYRVKEYFEIFELDFKYFYQYIQIEIDTYGNSN